MGLLKKENWFIIFLMMIVTLGMYVVIPAYQLKLIEKNKWYSDYRYWLCGALMFIFPVFIMLLVFIIQMTVKLAKTLHVNGDFIYNNVYVWIILLIIPVVGWVLFIVMYIYLQFSIIIKTLNN